MATDGGSITAEFATVLPAVMVVLLCCLGGMRLAGEQLQLQAIAAVGARALSRGDAAPPITLTRPAPNLSEVTLSRADQGDLVCVTASRSETLGLLGGLHLRATSCALGG